MHYTPPPLPPSTQQSPLPQTPTPLLAMPQMPPPQPPLQQLARCRPVHDQDAVSSYQRVWACQEREGGLDNNQNLVDK